MKIFQIPPSKLFLRLLFLCCCPIVFPVRSANASPEKLLLRLPYRGIAGDYKTNPKSVGLFTGQTSAYTPVFAGVDGQGNMYVVDPIHPGQLMLKCFDRRGQIRAQWLPIVGELDTNSGVTSDGTVWLGLSETQVKAGLPIVAYKLGQRTPIVDWRTRVPAPIKDSLKRALQSHKLQWPTNWVTYLMESGENRVSIRLLSNNLGRQGQVVNVLWMLCTKDGKQSLGARIGKANYGPETPRLMLDGQLWASRSNYSVETQRWSKSWLWPKNGHPNAPLFDFNANNQPWRGKINLGNVLPPWVERDKKGHIYLFWQKQESQLELNPKRSIVILNKNHRMIDFLPWRSNRTYHGKDWIKPRADGTGFYHIEFLDREARIYFHSFDGK